MPNGFAPIGVCTTLGPKKTAAAFGALAGVGTGAFIYIATGLPQKVTEETGVEGEEIFLVMSRKKRIIAALAGGALIGGLTAALGYFYCKGVEAGIPLKVK